MCSVYALVAAAGDGTRMGNKVNKQLLNLAGKPVVAYSLEALLEVPVDGIVVIVRPGEEDRFRACLKELIYNNKQISIVSGGNSREESVRLGLAAVPQKADLVVVHDGARPLIETEHIKEVIKQANLWDSAILAVPVKDTIKTIKDNDLVSETLSRETLRQVQTPQVFKYPILLEAHQKAWQEGLEATDDASLVEMLGYPVKLVRGDYANIKITTPEDLALAEVLLKNRASNIEKRASSLEKYLPSTPRLSGERGPLNSMPRIGIGYDVHSLQMGRPLILGGVTVPYHKGLLGHSDADVLVHAIMDALLGAAALGDIGTHFPDTDHAYLGISSLVLLEKVACMLQKRSWRLGNIDAVIIAQAPKLALYIEQMKTNIAQTMSVDAELINIKATTTERLGFVGRGEGIAAQATAYIYAIPQ